jgi:Domain of unknown function (DUF4402)
MLCRQTMLLCLGVTLGATGLSAQAPATVLERQDLSFGVVLPGMATSITPSDPVNAGRYEIRGAKNAEVRIDFQLPTALVAPDGTPMSLTISAGDGGYADQPNVRSQQAFDPNLPLIVSLGKSGKLYLWLGGTVLPTPTQAGGDYSATITVTVAYTGA